MTAKKVKKLLGIEKLNDSTLIFRADKYSGEFTESVRWLMDLHPSLTHSVTLTTRLEKSTRLVKITQYGANSCQDRPPDYKQRKNQQHNQLDVP